MNAPLRKTEDRTIRTFELEAGPNQRLEIELTHGPNCKRELVLRELSWGNGVGWFVHKSIHLDPGQVDGLLKALCCLRDPGGPDRRCPLVEERREAQGEGAPILRMPQ